MSQCRVTVACEGVISHVHESDVDAAHPVHITVSCQVAVDRDVSHVNESRHV